jgi:hypothetical protein
MEGALARNHDVRVLFEFCPRASRAAGSSAEELLGFLRERDFLLYQTAGSEPQRVNDLGLLISNTSGRRYSNLLASRESLHV